jgi:hypothetical protein
VVAVIGHGRRTTPLPAALARRQDHRRLRRARRQRASAGYVYSRATEVEARQAKMRSEDQGTLGGGAGSKKCATTTAAMTARMANPIAS